MSEFFKKYSSVELDSYKTKYTQQFLHTRDIKIKASNKKDWDNLIYDMTLSHTANMQ